MSNAAQQTADAFTRASKSTSELKEALEAVVPSSLPARVGQLAIGQTCSESKFLDFDTTSRASFEQSVKALRSTMSKAVARAASRTGNTYITVTGDHRTRDGDLIVVATAVRTA